MIKRWLLSSKEISIDCEPINKVIEILTKEAAEIIKNGGKDIVFVVDYCEYYGYTRLEWRQEETDFEYNCRIKREEEENTKKANKQKFLDSLTPEQKELYRNID